MLRLSENINLPVAIRYPRGEVDRYDLPHNSVNIAEPEVVFDGGDIAIITVGHIFKEGYRLYHLLKEKGIDATMIILSFIKPLNKDLILKHLNGRRLVVTIEENSLQGGMGEYIQSMVNDADIFVKFIKFGIPDIFVEHGDLESLRSLVGLKAEQMAEKLFNLLKL